MTTPAHQDYQTAKAGLETLNQQLDQAKTAQSELHERLIRMIVNNAMGIDSAEAIDATRQAIRTTKETIDIYPDAIKIAEHIVQQKYKTLTIEHSAARKAEKADKYAQSISELIESPKNLTLDEERELRTLAPHYTDAVKFITAMKNHLFIYGKTPNPPVFVYPQHQQ